METLDLKDFEWKTVIRRLTMDDFDALVEMQLRCFPDMKPWSREHIQSQIDTFPNGQICVEIDGKLAASASSLIVEYDPNMAWHNWSAISDNGFIRNHNPKGDTLYGIEIMVDPEFRGMRLSRRLYDARKELCRNLNLSRIIIGGRIPGYHLHSDEMSAREYIDKVIERALFDPVLTAQLSNGFALQGLIPNYLPADKASCGYATFLEWLNLDYRANAKRRYHHVVEPIRLAVVQYEMRAVKDFSEFATQCEFFIDVASDYKSDFVVFPELFTTQLLSCVPASRPGQAARQLAEFTPQYLDLFTEMAVKHNVNIIGGSQFVIEDETLYNISYLFRRDGTLGKQYKIHITPSERKWWGVSPGDKVEVFDTDCGKISILVCYDIEFPELVRIAAQKDAGIVFVPFNTDTRQGYLRIRHCALARCVENHVYVAVSGCTGNLPFVENSDLHYAQSAIFTPADAEFARDAIAAECNPNIETMIIHDVDVEQLRRHRESGNVQNWNDRRRDLYKVVYREDNMEREI
ncbi:bifunctional GNAT family N-acetyltransferase/carbon-nitrogen hydrolase family protein [Blastopirellula marina]|uniref:Carbon-nitrogen hydrolase n=1 Tax=Blastopirellula marina TaxID=124 RepID=A0A2S8F403_9BACT|nr:bifunctional GNAT family N-acetyltransferase/carbon-nitrogen hydrolase family protein [Blastopirellula marina]PQO26881.1 carbon-nitrogen hydrolase [Blastopirellula marina]PTL41088.1 GNAT family N-acetyltransferase [Blastopirellula marina]